MQNFVLRLFSLIGFMAVLAFFQNCSTYDGAGDGVTNGKQTIPNPTSVQYCAADFSLSGSTCLNKGAGVVVTLAGLPADVENKMNNCKISLGWFGASGNGLYVEWGDGQTTPKYLDTDMGKSCTDVVKTHAYPGPGVYQIKIRSWHPGPTDAPITDWQKTITIVINN